MSAPTVAVTCTANDQNGQPVAGARFRARLNQTEIYTGFVVPELVEVLADANGQAVLHLWPNALGVAGSLYSVIAVNPDTGKRFLDAMISVPATACNLHEIVVQEPYPLIDASQQALIAAQGALAPVTEQAAIAVSKAKDASISALSAQMSQVDALASAIASEAARLAGVLAQSDAKASSSAAQLSAALSASAANAALASQGSAAALALTATNAVVAAAASQSAALASQMHIDASVLMVDALRIATVQQATSGATSARIAQEGADSSSSSALYAFDRAAMASTSASTAQASQSSASRSESVASNAASAALASKNTAIEQAAIAMNQKVLTDQNQASALASSQASAASAAISLAAYPNMVAVYVSVVSNAMTMRALFTQRTGIQT